MDFDGFRVQEDAARTKKEAERFLSPAQGMPQRPRRLSFCCSHVRLHEIYDMLIYVTYVNHYHILLYLIVSYCILLYLIVSYCPSTLHGSILDCFLGAAVRSCCPVFRNRGSSFFVFLVVLWLSWLFLEKLGRDHGGF